MNLKNKLLSAGLTAAALGVVLLGGAPAWAQTWPTQVLPAEDVANTKHNFFLNQDIGYSTTNTTEICVFCHTPHGGRPSTASTAVPLWNRAFPNDAAVYTMYDSPNFDGQQFTKPQGVSLACLSCHDGSVGIDSLINAPGSGGFIAANKAVVPGADVSMKFHPGAVNGVDATGSLSETLRDDCVPGSAVVNEQCFHATLGPQTNQEFFAGAPGGFAATFGMAPFPNLTQDLSDDHPISMQIPDGSPNSPVDPQFAAIVANFPTNNSKANGLGVTWITRSTANTLNADVRDRIRAYPTNGANTEYVECASCHNPHTPRPLFLRLPNVSDPNGASIQLVSGGGNTAWAAVTGNVADTQYISNNPNFQSAICLSCHEK